MKKILVFAPHPDDETLGVGGTLLKHIAQGDSVFWCIVTIGNSKMGHNATFIEKWASTVQKVEKQYGLKKTYKLKFPTGELDQTPLLKLVDAISKVVKEVEPTTVYFPNGGDIHTDHQISFKAMMSCSKSFRYPSIKKILVYETISETEFAPPLLENCFLPNYFVDISSFFKEKLEIMKLYKSEVMEAPFPRSLQSIESLARYRGSRIGVSYAESFMLLQEIA